MEIKELMQELSAFKGVSNSSMVRDNVVKLDIDKNSSKEFFTKLRDDFGFEHWVQKAVEFHGNEGDLLIVISSSGQSENMLNGVQAARNGNFKSVVTISGFAEENPLKQLGDINLWVDSKAYNFVENIHQIWLLAITDLVIGKREYSAK